MTGETRLRSPSSSGTAVAPGPSLDRPASHLAAAAGYRLNRRYELLNRLGAGAMGEVWRARDLEAVAMSEPDPYVAIKLLNAQFSLHPDAARGLYGEAKKAHMLAHENVATVYEFARDESTGAAFIAMEMLEGQPLDQFLADTGNAPLTRHKALAILRGICAGLAYAHRKHIVHSDLKPANIFLTHGDVPKILDFGIARTVSQDTNISASSTDVFVGFTPEYAAPETMRGGDPDPADDVYSLSVVAYELLSGRHPFDRRTALDAQEAGARPLVIKGLARREWRAFERGLAFQRDKRFRDAGEFARALQGMPARQKVLVAVLACAMTVAAGLQLRNYQVSLPDTPYDNLPQAVRSELDHDLAQGHESLDYIAQSGDVAASADAADFFAAAYRLHPRNPDAVAGLEAAADVAIDWYLAQGERAAARDELRTFAAKSEFYDGYEPIRSALQGLNEPP